MKKKEKKTLKFKLNLNYFDNVHIKTIDCYRHYFIY